MALVSTSLVPVLYDIVKELETMQRLYGSVQRLGSADGGEINKSEHLLSLAEKIQMYNEYKKGLHSQRRSLKGTAVLFFILFMLILTASFIIVSIYVGMKVLNIFRHELDLRAISWLIVLASLFAIIFSYLVILTVSVFRRNMMIYNKTYDVDKVEQTSDQINKLARMFRVVDRSSTSMTIETNHPLLAYRYSQTHKNKQINIVPSFENNEQLPKTCCEDIGKLDKTTFMGSCVPGSHQRCLYPFTPTAPISTVTLRKDIEKLDMYGQLARLRRSMDWIMQFFRADLDALAERTTDNGSDARRQVVEILTKKVKLVNNLHVKSSLPGVSCREGSSCYNIQTAGSQVSTYDAHTNTCITAPLDNVTLTYNPENNSSDVLLVAAEPNATVVDVLSSTLNSTAFKRGSSDKKFGVVRCSDPNMRGRVWYDGMVAKEDGLTYAGAFSSDSPSSTQTPATYSCRFSDIPSNVSKLVSNEYMDQVARYIVKNVGDVQLLGAADLDDVATQSGVPLSSVTLLMQRVADIRREDGRDKEEEEGSRYITFDRFLQKMNKLTSSQFVLEFLHHADVVRYTSQGLRNFHFRFDFSSELHKRSVTLKRTSLAFYIVAAILMYILFAMYNIRQVMSRMGERIQPVEQTGGGTQVQMQVVFVEGLGCTNSADDVQKMEEDWSKRLEVPFKLMCDSSKIAPLTTIVKTYCNKPPSQDLPYVTEVCNVVADALKNNVVVILCGHSYGGAVVSMVADKLEPNNRLHCLTFGSIYVPKSDTKNKVTHYMFNNDVAITCNGLKSTGKRENVIWLQPPLKASNAAMKNDLGWDIHNMYGEFIIKDIKARLDAIRRNISYKSQPQTFATTYLYTPQKEVIINSVIEHIGIIWFIILSCIVFNGHIRKIDSVFMYNHMLYDKNGAELVESSNKVMGIMLEEARRNGFGVTATSSKFVFNSAPFVRHGIHINKDEMTSLAYMSIAPEQIFNSIAKESIVDDKTLVRVSGDNMINMEELYNHYINMLTAYTRCNNVVNNNVVNPPFPMQQVIYYCVALVLSVTLICYILVKFKTKDRVADYIFLSGVKRRLHSDNVVAQQDVEQAMARFDNSDDNDQVEERLFIKVCGCIAIIVVGVYLANSIQLETNDFVTDLYARTGSECYV